MITREYVVLMASYNEWMNVKLYEAAATLPPQALAADKKAFFGSLLGTLNHVAVADQIWLTRFAAHFSRLSVLDPVRQLPTPAALNELLFTDLAALRNRRQLLDGLIKQWAAVLNEDDLSQTLRYTTLRGVAANKRLSDVIVHFFNHQTHHRGQASTLLSQTDVDLGITDLIAHIPDDGMVSSKWDQ